MKKITQNIAVCVMGKGLVYSGPLCSRLQWCLPRNRVARVGVLGAVVLLWLLLSPVIPLVLLVTTDIVSSAIVPGDGMDARLIDAAEAESRRWLNSERELKSFLQTISPCNGTWESLPLLSFAHLPQTPFMKRIQGLLLTANSYSSTPALTTVTALVAEAGVSCGVVRVEQGVRGDERRWCFMGRDANGDVCSRTTLFGSEFVEAEVVPRDTHQTWKSIDPKTVYPRWRKLYRSWVQESKQDVGTSRVTWTDTANDNVVRIINAAMTSSHPSSSPLPSWYANANVPVERFDIFRYFVMFASGGVYADMDVGRYLGRNWHTLYSHPAAITKFPNGQNSQGFFMAKAGHPFLARLLRRLPHYMAAANSVTIWSEMQSVFWSTGPSFFSMQRTLMQLEQSSLCVLLHLCSPPPPDSIPYQIPLRFHNGQSKTSYIRHRIGGTWETEELTLRYVHSFLTDTGLFFPLSAIAVLFILTTTTFATLSFLEVALLSTIAFFKSPTKRST